MARLTDAQIAGYAKGAGFSGNALAIIVAIALAESGGRTDAHNPVPPDDSYGLLQVNMIGSMGPARRKQYGLSANTDLYNPAINMKVGYALSNGGKSFRAWSTYTTGAYLVYMSRAQKAAGNPDTSGSTAGGTGVEQASANPLSWPGEIVDFFTFISDPITWMRLGMIIAGGVAVIYSLAQMSGQVDKVKSAVGVATDILPQTRAVKAAAKAV